MGLVPKNPTQFIRMWPPTFELNLVTTMVIINTIMISRERERKRGETKRDREKEREIERDRERERD